MPKRIFFSPPHLAPLERERLLAAFDCSWVTSVGSEIDARPLHPLISHARFPPLRPVDLRALPITGPRDLVAAAPNLIALAPVNLGRRTQAEFGQRPHVPLDGQAAPYRRASDSLVVP